MAQSTGAIQIGRDAEMWRFLVIVVRLPISMAFLLLVAAAASVLFPICFVWIVFLLAITPIVVFGCAVANNPRSIKAWFSMTLPGAFEFPFWQTSELLSKWWQFAKAGDVR
jgi:hypothetical protein